MPRVSAIIPAYNAAATLAEALDSALSQSFRDREVIVVDDGSTDNTARILESYAARVKVVTQPNSGPAAARNTGVHNAGGEYLAFLDADDKWMPAFLARTVTALDAKPDCVMAYCDLSVIDSNGVGLGTTLIGTQFAHAPSMDEILAQMWPIMPSGALIRRSAFERCGGFCEQFKRASFEDAHMFLLLREQGPFEYIPESLAVWRFSRFPRPLKRGGSPEAARLFRRLVRQRYGISGDSLTRSRQRATRSILGYIGLTALHAGNYASARQAFAAALRIDPLRIRNYFRYVRTFLPSSIARALSGRTGHRPHPLTRRTPNRGPNDR